MEEISGKEEYRNWVAKKKGFLPIPPKLDFLCCPAKVSAHRKVELKSKPNFGRHSTKVQRTL